MILKRKKNRWTGCLGNFSTLIIFSFFFFFLVIFLIENFFTISFTPLFVRLSYYYNAFIKNYSFVFSVLVFFSMHNVTEPEVVRQHLLQFLQKRLHNIPCFFYASIIVSYLKRNKTLNWY